MAADNRLSRDRNFQLGQKARLAQLGVAQQLASIRSKRRRASPSDPSGGRFRGPGGYGVNTGVVAGSGGPTPPTAPPPPIDPSGPPPPPPVNPPVMFHVVPDIDSHRPGPSGFGIPNATEGAFAFAELSALQTMVAAAPPGQGVGYALGQGPTSAPGHPTVLGGGYDIPSQTLILNFSEPVQALVGVTAGAWTLTATGSVTSDLTGVLGPNATQSFHMSGVAGGVLGHVTGDIGFLANLKSVATGAQVFPPFGGIDVSMTS